MYLATEQKKYVYLQKKLKDYEEEYDVGIHSTYINGNGIGMQ